MENKSPFNWGASWSKSDGSDAQRTLLFCGENRLAAVFKDFDTLDDHWVNGTVALTGADQ